jgi:hypothetical protein
MKFSNKVVNRMDEIEIKTKDIYTRWPTLIKTALGLLTIAILPFFGWASEHFYFSKQKKESVFIVENKSTDSLNKISRKDHLTQGSPLSLGSDYGIWELGNKTNPKILTIRTQEITDGLNLIFNLPNDNYERAYPIKKDSYFPRHYSIEIGKYKFFILVENIRLITFPSNRADMVTLRIFTNDLSMCTRYLIDNKKEDSILNYPYNHNYE